MITGGDTATLVVTGEGVSTVTFYSVDRAGNAEAPQTLTLKIDKTPPVINVVSPRGSGYLLNQEVRADFSCADGGAGVGSCVGATREGGAVDTSSAGLKEFVVTATDLAGNSGMLTVRFPVIYGVRALYDEGGPHKSGSAVPVKLQLRDAAGRNVSSPHKAVTLIGVKSASAAPGEPFRMPGRQISGGTFRFIADRYQHELKTDELEPGSYLLGFVVGAEARTYTLRFVVR